MQVQYICADSRAVLRGQVHIASAVDVIKKGSAQRVSDPRGIRGVHEASVKALNAVKSAARPRCETADECIHPELAVACAIRSHVLAASDMNGYAKGGEKDPRRRVALPRQSRPSQAAGTYSSPFVSISVDLWFPEAHGSQSRSA